MEYAAKESDRIARTVAALVGEREAVVLAVGSDRVTGDCLGPLVGHMLAGSGAAVYGTLTAPVTALSVTETYETIKKRHPGAAVDAVDSAVGSDGEVGRIKIFPRGIRPAAAVGRTLPGVGDISVVGVVCPKREGAKALGSVRLGEVYTLARTIADGLERALLRTRARAAR